MLAIVRRLLVPGYVKRTIYNQAHAIDPYTIRQMKLPDLPKVMQLLHVEKWYMEKAYLECAYSTDPTGFFVADSGWGDIIGTANFLSHQENIIAAGLCVVRRDCRNSSVGLHLGDHVLGTNSTKITILFVWPHQVHWMEKRYGLSPTNSYLTWYNYGRIDPRKCLNKGEEDFTLLPVELVSFLDLIKYDKGVHLVPRPDYLHHWIHNSSSTTCVAFRDDMICGYGVLRSQDSYNQIGPLYADDDCVALALFRDLASHLSNDQTVGYSCPVTNGLATHFAAQNGMMKSGFPLVCMSKPKPFEVDLKRVYAMSSVSFGIC